MSTLFEIAYLIRSKFNPGSIDKNVNSRQRTLMDESVQYLLDTEKTHDTDEIEDLLINISALRAYAWEQLHIGKWSEVDAMDRRTYAFATYVEVLMELENFIKCNPEIGGKSSTFVEHLIESVDMGILLGDGDYIPILCEAASLFSSFLSTLVTEHTPNLIEINLPVQYRDYPSSIPVINEDEWNTFEQRYYQPGQPVLINSVLRDWPALTKWQDLSYFQNNFGYRTVPVEIGSQYTSDDWGQQLLLLKDFLASQFGNQAPDTIQYLAQHNLFDQIPELLKDIRDPQLLESLIAASDECDRKIWFGPSNTISPIHYDKKENFLCQVLGYKQITLVCPEHTEFLYPFEGDMLHNTSQLDLSQPIDFERFPLAQRASFRDLLIAPGQTLFIPYGWWHFVRSLTPSISVSFWWNKKAS